MTKKNFFTGSKSEAESVTDQPGKGKSEAEPKINTAKLKLEVLENLDPSRFVESVSMKPRGKKGSGTRDGVQCNVRIDRHLYDKIAPQTYSTTLTVNALLQYALDDLEAKNLKIRILGEE